MGVEVNKIIYSMVGVSKFYNNKPILKVATRIALTASMNQMPSDSRYSKQF